MSRADDYNNKSTLSEQMQGTKGNREETMVTCFGYQTEVTSSAMSQVWQTGAHQITAAGMTAGITKYNRWASTHSVTQIVIPGAED